MSAALTLLLFTVGATKSSGYDSYVYENLQKSRDALLSQRAGLERTRTDLLGQLDRLQAKITRIDSYLRQVDGSIKDVDDAIRAVR
jgi:uncharacterized protein YoxC